MASYREAHETPLHKEHPEVMEQLVMVTTLHRMVSEVLFLSLLMFESIMSVLSNERYNGAQEYDHRERWGSGSHL